MRRFIATTLQKCRTSGIVCCSRSAWYALTLRIPLSVVDLAALRFTFSPSHTCAGSRVFTVSITAYLKVMLNVLTHNWLCTLGLWPDPEATCTNCAPDKPFNMSSLSTKTLADMNKYWPTCVSGNTNQDFWSHEWSKHGTCTGMSQEKYFSYTVELFQKYNTGCLTDCYVCLTPTFTYEGINVC
jgi:hypothetical protein